ncbi:MAG: InlB B-repeat-containing protein, partial [Anaeroplasmataceae bacterium]|nr:InlB B-repeat-containing protein [Anaeroplasmataceae bacterium]
LPATLPPVADVAGWHFVGWYTTENFAEGSEAVAGATLTANITLYAKWEAVTYSITYNMHGHGTAPANVAEATALPATLPPIADEEDWRFAGWYLDSTFKTKAEAGAALTANATLHAKWESKYEQVVTEVYWLDQTYDTANGSTYSNVDVLSGATLDTSTKSIKVNSGQTLALPRLKTNGGTSGVSLPGTYVKGEKISGTPTAKGIKVTVAGAGKIHFYVAAAGSGARTLALIDAQGTIIDFVSTTDSNMKEYTWSLPAEGVYYFVNSNGFNFYYIETDVKALVSQATGISVSSKGTVDYLEGTEKDFSNLQLTTDYENGSKRPLALEDVTITTDYDKTVPGVYTVQIQSKENPSFTTSYTVTVYSFAGIELGFDKTVLGGSSSAGNQQYINKTVQRVYKKGASLNHNNLTVIAIGKDSANKEHRFILDANSTAINYDKNNAFVSSTAGDYEIVVGVTFNGITKTDSYDVSVVDAAVCVENDVIQLHADGAYAGVIGDAVDGANNFKTIQQALDFLGTLSSTELQNKSILLTLAEGTYKEKIELTYPNMTIRGAGKETTKIEWDSLYGVPDKSGYIQTTDSTATVNVRHTAKNVLIEDVTISNYWNSKAVFDADLGANYPEHRALALLVQSDQFIMKNGKLLGYQDTLELFTGRQVFFNTYISGTTDFIFGTNNTTYFKGCQIHSITSGKTDGGYITAFKGCNKGENDYVTYGAIFDECTFTADADVVANKNTAIARPWGKYAAVMVMNSSLDGHISTTAFNGSAEKNCRYVIMSGNAPTLATVKFFEYNNTGAGSISANQSGVTVLTEWSQAAKYADFSVIFATTNGALSGAYTSVWNPTLE